MTLLSNVFMINKVEAFTPLPSRLGLRIYRGELCSGSTVDFLRSWGFPVSTHLLLLNNYRKRKISYFEQYFYRCDSCGNSRSFFARLFEGNVPSP